MARVRLGKAERQLVRDYHAKRRAHIAETVQENYRNPPPKPLRYAGFKATPDALMSSSHTSGFSLGQRRLKFQKPGSY